MRPPVQATRISSQDGMYGAGPIYDRSQGLGITLPPFFDAAMEAFGGGFDILRGSERVMRYMMRDPILFGTDRIVRALVTEGEHTIEGRVEEPKEGSPEDKEEWRRSEEARKLTEAYMDRLPRNRKAISWHLMEAVGFGSKLCEVETANVGSNVEPVDISPKPRTAYRWDVTRSNKVNGVRVSFGTDNVLVPATQLLWLTVGGMDDDPNGGPALQAAYDAWYRKNNYLRDEVIASAQSAGSNLVLSQPNYPDYDGYDGMVPVEVVDAQGNVTIERKPETQVAAEAGAGIRNGTSSALPAGWKAEFLSALSQGFGEQIDRCDREMITAFVGSARMTKEAENGSRADSDTAEGVAMTMRDWYRGLLCAAWERMFANFIEFNLGKDYLDVVPRYVITTDEPEDLGAVGALLSGLFDRLSLGQKNALARRLNIPDFVKGQETTQSQQVPKVNFRRGGQPGRERAA